MLNRLSVALANCLCRGSDNDDETVAICAYGMETLLYTIISTTGLLLVGYICNRLIESVAIVGVYYTNQTIGGGFHAKSHMRCFLVMVLCLTIALLISSLNIAKPVLVFLCLFSAITLIKHPLVLHENKRYLLAHQHKLIVKSIISIVILSVVAILTVLSQWRYASSLTIGLGWAAISRTIAYWQLHNQQT